MAARKHSQKKVVAEKGEQYGTQTPPPAYFLNLKLSNVRCFGEEQTLDLSDSNGRPARWTVILGENGTGKTTLLQCLAMMEPVDAKTKFLQLGTEDSNLGVIPKAGISHHFSILASLFRNRASIKLGTDIASGSALSESKQKKNIVTHMVWESYNYGQTGASDIANYYDIGNLKCYGYGALRQVGKTELSDEAGDATASLFSSDPVLINAEEWLLKADYSYKSLEGAEKARALQRRQSIEDILTSDLLPGVNKIRWTKPDTNLSQNIRVEFHTPYGWVPLQQLGFGYQTMIAWTVDLAARLWQRYPNSANPLAEPAVVLVDEIDLHLHPRWQRNLINFLTERFPNTQFIATAHSPLVVQAAADDANIVLLRREDDHVVIENHVPVNPNLRVDQLLTSELFGLESARSPKVEELLEERTKILSKSRLTARDKKKLEELDEKIDDLPTGETPEDIEAMDIIRRAASILKKQNGK